MSTPMTLWAFKPLIFLIPLVRLLPESFRRAVTIGIGSPKLTTVGAFTTGERVDGGIAIGTGG